MSSYIPYESYAAVDLGSNSFHMIVANYNDSRLQVIDMLKEMVRLASGLDKNNCLTDESMDTAIKCLEKFGQRIREIPRTNVRAVGTNTLRRARNGYTFLNRAYEALGHPIEIISGHEEARLVYLGVAHSVYGNNDKRLVIDIGGGSTELIIGQGFEPYLMESLYMGCVGISQRFFEDGEISEKKMRRAILFARQELESIEAIYKKTGWDSVIGSSGSILSIKDVIQAQEPNVTVITMESLQALKEQIISLGKVSALNLDGLTEARRPVFTGGVAILSAIYEALKIDQMSISDGALREGLLHDMIGRLHDEDIRDRTISEIARRYSTDTEQAERIEKTVLQLFDNVKNSWDLSKTTDTKLLSWAARIHEIGMTMAHSQYHWHGAYLVTNSNLPGFSNQDQLKLAMLIRSHRRKFPVENLEEIPVPDRTRVTRLCILIRVAVLLNRSRFYTSLPKIKISARESELKLVFPKEWLNDHPLTHADLETEKDYLRVLNFKLLFN